MILEVVVAVVTAGALVDHGRREYHGGLARFLARAVGFAVPPWLPPVLLVAAMIPGMGSLVGAWAMHEWRAALLAAVVGALVTDAIGTHVLASWYWPQSGQWPATETVPVYLALAVANMALAVAYGVSLPSAALAFCLGGSGFVLLWAVLPLLTYLGALRK